MKLGMPVLDQLLRVHKVGTGLHYTKVTNNNDN